MLGQRFFKALGEIFSLTSDAKHVMIQRTLWANPMGAFMIAELTIHSRCAWWQRQDTGGSKDVRAGRGRRGRSLVVIVHPQKLSTFPSLHFMPAIQLVWRLIGNNHTCTLHVAPTLLRGLLHDRRWQRIGLDH